MKRQVWLEAGALRRSKIDSATDSSFGSQWRMWMAVLTAVRGEAAVYRAGGAILGDCLLRTVGREALRGLCAGDGLAAPWGGQEGRGTISYPSMIRIQSVPNRRADGRALPPRRIGAEIYDTVRSITGGQGPSGTQSRGLGPIWHKEGERGRKAGLDQQRDQSDRHGPDDRLPTNNGVGGGLSLGNLGYTDAGHCRWPTTDRETIVGGNHHSRPKFRRRDVQDDFETCTC